MSLCGSRFVFQKACVRRETSWPNMGTADDYIYNLLVDAYNIRKGCQYRVPDPRYYANTGCQTPGTMPIPGARPPVLNCKRKMNKI